VTAGRAPQGPWGAIFDLDDTLYPRSAYVESAFVAVAGFLERTQGLAAQAVLKALDAAHTGACVGRELQAVCERFELPGSFVWQLRQVMRTHQPRLALPPASRTVLTRLRASGWRLCVLTNGLPAVQRRKVEALGIDALVHHVVCAQEHSRIGKPEPRPFRVALERLRVTPSRCAFVGDDAVADIAGARGIGLRTVWVRQETRAEVPTTADAVVTRLVDVPEALSRLKRASVSDAA
jgi:putative hydrolase of the HAD superfamily